MKSVCETIDLEVLINNNFICKVGGTMATSKADVDLL